MSRCALLPPFARLPALCLLAALAVLPVVLSGAGIAHADGDEEEDLVLQVFHVGAFTSGRAQFLGEVPPPVGPAESSDEERPLYGTEGEEPILTSPANWTARRRRPDRSNCRAWRSSAFAADWPCHSAAASFSAPPATARRAVS